MSYIVVGLTCLVLGFVAGLLTGRKNPKIADIAFNIAEKNKP